MITIKEAPLANGEKILVPEMGFAHAFGLYLYDNVGHFLNEMIIVARGGTYNGKGVNSISKSYQINQRSQSFIKL